MAGIEHPRTRVPERTFYLILAVAVSAFIVVSFSAYQLFVSTERFSTLPLLIVAHAIVMLSWLTLLVMQATLVSYDRVDLHRRVGPWGAALAVVLTALGTLVAIYAARHGYNPGRFARGPLSFLIVPVGDLIVFASLVLTAIVLRRQSDAHKRLMLLATISLMFPAITRLPLHPQFFVPEALAILAVPILAGVWFDIASRGRVHPAYIYGGPWVLLSVPIRGILSGTDAWMNTAKFINGLV